MNTALRLALAAHALAILAACGGSSSGGGGNPGLSTPVGDGRVFKIALGEDATAAMTAASTVALPGDVIEFDCGYYELSAGLLLQATEDVLIRGCGINETVLSFKNSENVTGIEAINVRGVTIENLTVLDTPGDGIKLKSVNWGTLRNVRTMWSGSDTTVTADNYAEALIVACTSPPFNEGDAAPDYGPRSDAGRYGIYPVESDNILVEGSESIGASDAGIYVGQTNNAIIRNSRAAYNVMGFEIENVQGGEYDSNIAECNTGGYLIYDLNHITQYGDITVMHNNMVRNNNLYNFASGGLVAAVPRGTGFITLGYDRIEVRDNHFEDHSTAAVIYVSYQLLHEAGDRVTDNKMDRFTEGLHIFNNTMVNSGYDIPPPNFDQVSGGNFNTLLPTLVALKNIEGGGTGAHILWDGYRAQLDADCPYPVDADGNPVPADERGKPQHTDEHPNPECHYNAYKFDDQEQLILPDWGSCIHNNELSSDSQAYLNFHGMEGFEVLLAAANQDPGVLTDPMGIAEGVQQFQGSTDLGEHDCMSLYGSLLPSLPLVTIPPFSRSGTIDPAPDTATVDRLCAAGAGGSEVNRGALAVNCPDLADYNLFSNPQDPRSAPNGGGVPFVLNTKLFSDYATKYRVAFLPPGKKATWRDGDDGASATLSFPEGTVLAKTFAFTDESAGSEEVIETRLLIKRRNASGQPLWVGLPYIWSTDADSGERVAKLSLSGGQTAASWHYTDVDSGELHSGSTASYTIPTSNQCLTCHANDDQPSGSAPIGPKVRLLNRPYAPESSTATAQGAHPAVNQLKYWVDNGLLAGAPSLQIDSASQIATNVERLPRYNVPGDAGFEAGSGPDIEARARAYLEVNCQHCHNNRGAASNTGYYLDSLRAVDASYGICKSPTATGGGSCGRSHVVVPGSADASIVACRIAAESDPERRMPPIARSVAHADAVALIENWINNVVDATYENGDACP